MAAKDESQRTRAALAYAATIDAATIMPKLRASLAVPTQEPGVRLAGNGRSAKPAYPWQLAEP